MLARRRFPLVLALIGLAGCGHVVRPEFAPNWPGPKGFDFSNPPCHLSVRPSPPDDRVILRYLGAGGLYVEWQGTALLMSPFFSHRSAFQAWFGRLHSDPNAVRRGLDGMDLSRVRAIAAGHSHYDHLADLPAVAEGYARQARIYVNGSGAFALAAIPALSGRVTSLEEADDWIWLRDADGNQLPIRFHRVASEHAPQLWHYHYAARPIPGPWTKEWKYQRNRSLGGGKTFAFVIELMSRDLRQVRFRMYYQDAANPEGVGFPTFTAPGDPIDLAVLCMASYQFVHNHPESILEHLKPRHVLIAHYEDFFRDTREPVRFVFPLSNASANRFLGRLKTTLSGQETTGPEGTVCGPSTSGWTMPMPGEWMTFAARTP
jgi:hypothetical protein